MYWKDYRKLELYYSIIENIFSIMWYKFILLKCFHFSLLFFIKYSYMVDHDIDFSLFYCSILFPPTSTIYPKEREGRSGRPSRRRRKRCSIMPISCLHLLPLLTTTLPPPPPLPSPPLFNYGGRWIWKTNPNFLIIIS